MNLKCVGFSAAGAAIEDLLGHLSSLLMPALSRSGDSLPSTLLVRLRDQQPEAWVRLTYLFGPLVYGWCRRAGLSPPDAADVTQDTFRSVAMGLSRFRRDRSGDSFRGWLATITRNRIRDFFRRVAQRPKGKGGSDFQQLLENLPDSEADSDPEFAGDWESQRRSLLHRSLELVQAEFESNTWKAFWRTTIDTAAPEAVAAELGLSVNAVYKAKSRVLRRLRKELEGLVD
jgi:RNA polymerase sigma-70 factor (ECF subfamily)